MSYTLTMTGIVAEEIAQAIADHLSANGLPPGVEITITEE